MRKRVAHWGTSILLACVLAGCTPQEQGQETAQAEWGDFVGSSGFRLGAPDGPWVEGKLDHVIWHPVNSGKTDYGAFQQLTFHNSGEVRRVDPVLYQDLLFVGFRFERKTRGYVLSSPALWIQSEAADIGGVAIPVTVPREVIAYFHFDPSDSQKLTRVLYEDDQMVQIKGDPFEEWPPDCEAYGVFPGH